MSEAKDVKHSIKCETGPLHKKITENANTIPIEKH